MIIWENNGMRKIDNFDWLKSKKVVDYLTKAKIIFNAYLKGYIFIVYGCCKSMSKIIIKHKISHQHWSQY